MNLLSCTNCGVVLDKNHLNFPRLQDCVDKDDCLDDTKVEWVGHRYVTHVPCPVCQERILNTDSDDGDD